MRLLINIVFIPVVVIGFFYREIIVSFRAGHRLHALWMESYKH